MQRIGELRTELSRSLVSGGWGPVWGEKQGSESIHSWVVGGQRRWRMSRNVHSRTSEVQNLPCAKLSNTDQSSSPRAVPSVLQTQNISASNYQCSHGTAARLPLGASAIAPGALFIRCYPCDGKKWTPKRLPFHIQKIENVQLSIIKSWIKLGKPSWILGKLWIWNHTSLGSGSVLL